MAWSAGDKSSNNKDSLTPETPAEQPRSSRLGTPLDNAPYTGLQNQSVPQLDFEEVQLEGDDGVTLTFQHPGGKSRR